MRPASRTMRRPQIQWTNACEWLFVSLLVACIWVKLCLLDVQTLADWMVLLGVIGRVFNFHTDPHLCGGLSALWLTAACAAAGFSTSSTVTMCIAYVELSLRWPTAWLLFPKPFRSDICCGDQAHGRAKLGGRTAFSEFVLNKKHVCMSWCVSV